MPLEIPPPPGGRGDVIQRLELFAEQLEQSVALARAPRLASQRMALVALHNLAEVLLTEHAERCFDASDDAGWLAVETFPAKRRAEILRTFQPRVVLATRSFSGQGAPWYPRSILIETDAAVCRVAHKYRNDVYHLGTHNPVVLQPLCYLFAKAIATAFVRSIDESLWGGGEALAKRLAGLQRWVGCVDPAGTSFAPRSTADCIMNTIVADLRVDESNLRDALAEDITQRCAVAASRLIDLTQNGLSEEGVAVMVAAAQLWIAHRGDEVLVGEQERQRLITEQLVRSSDEDEKARLAQAFHESEAAKSRRMDELQGGFSFSFDVSSLSQYSSDGEKLRSVRGGLRGLLERYQQVDDRVTQFERAIGWIEISWERELDRREEAASGR